MAAAAVAASSGALAGKTFLLSGFEEAKERRQMAELITDNGGQTLTHIPDAQVGALNLSEGQR